MGGGATITRAATKVAGIGAVRGGLRGYHPASALPGEHSVGSGLRYAPAGIGLSHAPNSPAAAAQKSALAWDWEVDDWEFADYQGGSVPRAAEPMASVVFGDAPSFQEADAAAAELKDAVEKVYLSPLHSTSLVDSASEDDELETKSFVSTKSFDVCAAPKNAVQAFELLSQNSAVQSIVASIASDPNVWNAVVQNEAFMEYLQSQVNPKIPIGTDPDESESESESQGGWRSPTHGGLFLSDDKAFADFEDSLKNMFKNIKLSVTEMVTTVSDYLNNFFGSEKTEPDSRIARSMSLPERTVGASFMGLAVLVVIVVLLRRV